MKIAFCLNHFLPYHTAGTEIYTLELARQLLSKGHEVLVVTPHFGQTEDSRYAVDGVEVVRYAEPQVVDRSFIQNRKAPAGLVAFMNVIKNFRPDLVHFQELTASHGIGIFHVKAAKAAGYKTLMTFHLAGHSCYTGNLVYQNRELCDGIINTNKCARCGYASKALPKGSRYLLSNTAHLFYKLGYDTRRWQTKAGTALAFPFLIQDLKTSFDELANACDHVVSITAWYKQMLIKNGVEPSKISYILQGLRTQCSKSKAKENDGKIKLVFVGRVTRIKGLHLLIEALRPLPQNSISLTIYGPSNEDDYYNWCLQESKSMKNIFWEGRLQPETVVSTLSQFDVLCLPSGFSEMSPLVIQEAFAAGLPVLASKVYGNAEQVTHNKNGWLFPFEDAEALRRQLETLLAQPEIIEQAKRNLPPVRSFGEVANEYEKLYKKLVAAE